MAREKQQAPSVPTYLRLPPSLKRQTVAAAKRDGMTLNDFVLRALEQALEARKPASNLSGDVV